MFSEVSEHQQFIFRCFSKIYLYIYINSYGLSRWCSGKESTYRCRRHRRGELDLWVVKIPWSRKWQPTPLFLPGKSHGQTSLAGYSLWGHKGVGHD